MKSMIISGVLLLLLCAGCGELAIMNDTIPQRLDFFTCGQWVDKDNDGVVDWNEFDGAKTTFRSGEPMMFVGIFSQCAGGAGRYKLYSPGGKLIDEGTFTAACGTYVARVPYQVRDLLEKGGMGRWRMEWYLESLVNTTEVRLMP